MITSNLAFGEWPRVFGGDEKLTTALLDRLAEQATVLTSKGRSYRMRKRKNGREPEPSTSTQSSSASPGDAPEPPPKPPKKR